MITLTCTNCKATLEMDDAFAGGVCRCRYCGTIQTVPAQLRQPDPAVAAGGRSGSRALYNSPTVGATATTSSGLDNLADVVASSGLRSSRLRAQAEPAPVDYATPPSRPNNAKVIVIAAAAIALLLIGGFLAYLLTSRTVTVVSTPGGPGSALGSHFCGISLKGLPSVVYVLDRGEATGDLFDTLKQTTYRSVESLEAGQKFAIIFWDNGAGEAAYPADGLAPAGQGEIRSAEHHFEEVLASGRADPRGAIRKAAAQRPGAIILVTAKAFDLDEQLPADVQQALSGSATKVYTVALGSDDDSTVLKQIADRTGGQFHVVGARELRNFSYP